MKKHTTFTYTSESFMTFLAKKVKITSLLLFYTIIAVPPSTKASEDPDAKNKKNYQNITNTIKEHFKSDNKIDELKEAIEDIQDDDKKYLDSLIEDLFVNENYEDFKSYEELKKHFDKNKSNDWAAYFGVSSAKYEQKNFGDLLQKLHNRLENFTKKLEEEEKQRQLEDQKRIQREKEEQERLRQEKEAERKKLELEKEQARLRKEKLAEEEKQRKEQEQARLKKEQEEKAKAEALKEQERQRKLEKERQKAKEAERKKLELEKEQARLREKEEAEAKQKELEEEEKQRKEQEEKDKEAERKKLELEKEQERLRKKQAKLAKQKSEVIPEENKISDSNSSKGKLSFSGDGQKSKNEWNWGAIVSIPAFFSLILLAWYVAKKKKKTKTSPRRKGLGKGKA